MVCNATTKLVSLHSTSKKNTTCPTEFIFNPVKMVLKIIVFSMAACHYSCTSLPKGFNRWKSGLLWWLYVKLVLNKNDFYSVPWGKLYRLLFFVCRPAPFKFIFVEQIFHWNRDWPIWLNFWARNFLELSIRRPYIIQDPFRKVSALGYRRLDFKVAKFYWDTFKNESIYLILVRGYMGVHFFNTETGLQETDGKFGTPTNYDLLCYLFRGLNFLFCGLFLYNGDCWGSPSYILTEQPQFLFVYLAYKSTTISSTHRLSGCRFWKLYNRKQFFILVLNKKYSNWV